MLPRPSICRVNTATIARSSRTLLAVAVTAGLCAQTATTTATAEENQSAEAFLADLVNEASQKQDELNSVQNEMGGLREAANKSRADLDRAQREAQEAQDKTVSARDRLSASDADVNDAQRKLDDIARSAYKQGGHASPVTLAADGDVAAAQLDRASYVRLAAERQESVVNQLDLTRTQSANEDSRLRASREDADSAVSKAASAHKDAIAALQESQQKLKEISAEYQRLKTQSEAALAKLRAAKSAIDTLANSKPGASAFEKRAVAESAAAKASEVGEASESASAPQGEVSARESGVADDADKSTTTDSAPKDSVAEAQPEHAEPAQQPEPSSAPAEDAEVPADLHFESSASGDDHRQQAIDGLIAAGQSALFAGLGAAASGQSSQNALHAAAAAGSNTAGERYDSIVAAAGTATGANGAAESYGTVESQGTIEPEPEQTMPEDNPAQEAESQGVLVNPETGLQEAQPGEMPPVTSPQNGDLPPADSSVNTEGTAEEKIERVIDRAMSQLGVQYAWGGGDANGPTLGIRDGGVADAYGDYNKIGFDCSGLTLYAFAAVGIQLEHYTGYQYQKGRQVPSSEAKRGDLLFWGPGASQHVAIYLGEGKMLEAPQSGDVVKVSDVRYGGMTPYAVRLIE